MEAIDLKPSEVRQVLYAPLVWEDEHYLGMSSIAGCALRLYRDLVKGRIPSSDRGMRLKHEKAVHTRDVLDRLATVFEVVDRGREIGTFDPRFRGHIDGRIGNSLVMVRPVDARQFEYMRAQPNKYDVLRAQCYMHFANLTNALVIYKERDSGTIWVHLIWRRRLDGRRMEMKARAILQAVDLGVPPRCTCGHCTQAGGDALVDLADGEAAGPESHPHLDEN